MTLFSVSDLAAGYDGTPIVEGLSLTLEPGDCVALLGPSGSGKSTVLRALTLLTEPIRGELRLEDRTPAQHGIPRWRRKVHGVAQRAVFFFGTVESELERPFVYRAAEGAFDASRARSLLERLGLEHKWEERVDTLSEGERQRVGLVRSLLLAPSVLLLDEPTSALDRGAAEDVEAILSELRADVGLALVLVSHDPRQRDRLGARGIELDGGAVISAEEEE